MRLKQGVNLNALVNIKLLVGKIFKVFMNSFKTFKCMFVS